MKAKDYYNNVSEDLADLGIFIDKKDIHVLVYIVLRNIFNCCKLTDRLFLAKDRKISARIVKGHLKIYMNEDTDIKNKRLRMIDTASTNMFNSILLPSIEALLSSELD